MSKSPESITEKIKRMVNLIQQVDASTSKPSGDKIRAAGGKRKWMKKDHDNLEEIDALLGRLLVLNSGGLNHAVCAHLEDNYGLKVEVGEADSFGPLSVVIPTQRGALVYV